MVKIAGIVKRLGADLTTVRRLITRARERDTLQIEIHRCKGDKLLLAKNEAERLIAGYQARGGPVSADATDAATCERLTRSKKLAEVARKAAAKRIAAMAAMPRRNAPTSQSRKAARPAFLASGNPEIAKAEGDSPVQAYIAATPGRKPGVGRRLDAFIVRTVRGVREAAKRNSPLWSIRSER